MPAPVTLGRILPDQSKPSYEDLLAMVLKQQAEIEKAKATRSQPITCKVSKPYTDPKTGKTSTGGALSIYGLGRFPITLYVSQFDKLALAWPDVIDFVHDHRSELSVKD